ncbi:MAG TPA: ATP-binding protein [Planctomycetota bacterium]|nr:ATP-binding protein [Planctomycetota bacterium]
MSVGKVACIGRADQPLPGIVLPGAGADLLFEVVSRAFERTSLLVTTNLPFESWTEVLGAERLTGALLDRLTDRIHILEANGES